MTTLTIQGTIVTLVDSPMTSVAGAVFVITSEKLVEGVPNTLITTAPPMKRRKSVRTGCLALVALVSLSRPQIDNVVNLNFNS